MRSISCWLLLNIAQCCPGVCQDSDEEAEAEPEDHGLQTRLTQHCKNTMAKCKSNQMQCRPPHVALQDWGPDQVRCWRYQGHGRYSEYPKLDFLSAESVFFLSVIQTTLLAECCLLGQRWHYGQMATGACSWWPAIWMFGTCAQDAGRW